MQGLSAHRLLTFAHVFAIIWPDRLVCLQVDKVVVLGDDRLYNQLRSSLADMVTLYISITAYFRRLDCVWHWPVSINLLPDMWLCAAEGHVQREGGEAEQVGRRRH